MKIPANDKALRDVIKKLLEEHYDGSLVTVTVAGENKLQFYAQVKGGRYDFGIEISEGVEE